MFLLRLHFVANSKDVDISQCQIHVTYFSQSSDFADLIYNSANFSELL